MNRMPAEEVRAIRAKAYRSRACDELEEHEWTHLTGGQQAPTLDSPGIILLTLCRKCGRTPLEALNELVFVPERPS